MVGMDWSVSVLVTVHPRICLGLEFCCLGLIVLSFLVLLRLCCASGILVPLHSATYHKSVHLNVILKHSVLLLPFNFAM